MYVRLKGHKYGIVRGASEQLARRINRLATPRLHSKESELHSGIVVYKIILWAPDYGYTLLAILHQAAAEGLQFYQPYYRNLDLHCWVSQHLLIGLPYIKTNPSISGQSGLGR